MIKPTRRIWALMKKEMVQVIRDPSSIIITLFLPILLLFFFGYGVSLDIKHLRIGIALEDTAPEAQSFAAALSHSPYFEVVFSHSKDALIPELENGSIRGLVIIPYYFSMFKNTPSMKVPIQVIADGSETNTANFVENYVQGAFANWLEEEQLTSSLPSPPGVKSDARYWFNLTLESRYSLLSGALAIIMTLIGTLLTALIIAREWERGTMEALLSTTITKFELVAGKLIPYFLLGMISMILCVGVSILIFGLPFRGSFWVLAVSASCFLFSALGMGLMISTLSKVQLVASQYAIVVGFLPSYILSGFLFEISSMPAWIRALTYGIPARYFVECLQTLFLAGDVGPLILRNTLSMILIGIIPYFIIAKKLVKRLD